MPSIAKLGAFFPILVLVLLSIARHAEAIPRFAAQTGQPCSACHIGAFGPQLTPYGRDFKLFGYVAAKNAKDNFSDNWYERLSVLSQSSFTHTNANQYPPPGPGLSPNNNVTQDQVSAYYGGRITSTVGAFSEWSYFPIPNTATWDALDIRHAWEGELFDEDYVGGIHLGNQLGNTSIWNSTPPNAFPTIFRGSRRPPPAI